MRLLLRFLRSKRLAWVLLVLIALAAGMGNTVPQVGRDEFSLVAWKVSHPTVARLLPYVDGHNVFRSWWFLSLLVLLMLNTLACSLGMAAALLKREHRGHVAPIQPLTETPVAGTATEVEQRLRQRLASRGFAAEAVQTAGRIVIRAEKFPWGEWTGIAFHLCLVILFALMAVNSLLSWRGFVVLTEGDGFRGDAKSLHALAGPGPSGGYDLDVKLLRFNPRNKVANYIAEPASVLAVGSGAGMKEVTLTTGGGQRFGSTSAYQGLRYGVTFFLAEESAPEAPVFRISLPADEVADQTIVNAVSPSGRKLLIQPAFTPRIAENKRPLADRFSLRIGAWRLTKRGDVLADPAILVGQSTTSGSATIRLLDMRYWASYSLVYNPFLPAAYAVGWLAVAWLILGFFFYRRRLAFVVRAEEPGPTRVSLQVDGVKSRWLVKREGDAILRDALEEVPDHN